MAGQQSAAESQDFACAAPAIGHESQIFVDDDRIAARRGVRRTVHACTKLPHPVLESAMPWEGDAQDRRVYVYGTVRREAASGRLRMWYNRLNHVLLATSVDGFQWERPELGLVPFDGNRRNNLLPVRLHSPSVIRDEHETDPGRRYKMLGCIPRAGYAAAWSPDGLAWQLAPNNPVLPDGDTCTLAQDPRTGEFLAFHKRYHDHRGHPRRLVYLVVSSDMQTWSEPRLVLAPDAADDAQAVAEGGQWSEFYNLSVFPYGGQFLGLATHFRYRGRPDREGPVQSRHDGPIDVQLVHSRDGRTWRRLEERRPVIPNGPYAYDAGCVLGTANQPVMDDSAMWIAYTAITTTHGGFLPEKVITIARAAWRRDGFVSLDAGAAEGTVTTVAFSAAVADHLEVNADAARGDLRVEVLDAAGAVIPGYAAADCLPIRTDSVGHAVRWRDRDRLPGGQPIALCFRLRETILYSYRCCGTDGMGGAGTP